MSRVLTLGTLVAYLVVFAGCYRPSDQTTVPDERYLSVPSSVGFDIQSMPDSQNSSGWLATYTAQGKTARFRIELGDSKPIDEKGSKQFATDIRSGRGQFVAENGSDPSVLLADLKRALEAKTMPASVRRSKTLPFTFVSFGSHESQASGGGFNAKPPGNWTPMKIFIGEGDREGQVFLNLNPVLKKGQFSIKDADYGDTVLAQLAQVL